MLRLFISIFMLSSFVISQVNDGPIVAEASGTIPFVVSFKTLNADGLEDSVDDYSLSNGNLATVTAEDYDRTSDNSVSNYFDLPNIIDIFDFDANSLVNVNVQKSGWTSLPDGYVGAKQGDGSDNSDFLIKVDITNTGYSATPSEGLVAQGSFGTNFVGLDNASTRIMEGGLASHGLENGAFNIDARILLDWLTDIPGTYTVQLTLSVEEGS